MTRTHNKVADLPEPVLDEVHRLLSQGVAYRDIVAHLHRLGQPISKSSLGRYAKPFLQRQQRLADTVALAGHINALTGTAGLEEAAMALLLELITGLLMTQEDLVLNDDNVLTLDQAIRLLSTLSRAQGSAIQRDRWQAEVAARAAQAAEAVEQKALSEGLSPQTVDAIKAEILGIPPELTAP